MHKIHYAKPKNKTVSLCGRPHNGATSKKWKEVTCKVCIKNKPKKKKPTGGPKPKWKPEYANIIFKMIVDGNTELEVAKTLDIDRTTLWAWKNSKPELSNIVERAQEANINRTVRSLLEVANGYTHVETKVFNDKGNIVTHDVVKHYPPNVPAIQYYLNNKDPKNWKRDTGPEFNINPAEDLNINVTFDGKPL